MDRQHVLIGVAVLAMAAATGFVGYMQGWVGAPDLRVELTATWPDGSALEGASVRALGVARGETDEQGQLSFAVRSGIGEEVAVVASLDRPGMKFEPWEGSFVVRKWARSDPDSIRYSLEAVLEPVEVGAMVEVMGVDGPVSGVAVRLSGKTGGKTDSDGRLAVPLGVKRSRSTRVDVKLKGYERWTRKVILEGGRTLVVDLEKIGTVYGRATAAYESMGRVVRVKGAEVTLGGRKLGRTDAKGRIKFPVPDRTAELLIRKDGYLPDPAEKNVRGGTAVLRLFPERPPSYRLVVLPPRNGSPGNREVEAALPEIEDRLADYLASFGCFELVDARSFATAMRKANRSQERLLEKGWAGTSLVGLADAVVASEAALDEDLVLSVEVVSLTGKRLGAFAETQRLSKVRKLAESAAEKVREIFPFEGYVTLLGGQEVTTNLGSSGERGVRRRARVKVYRWTGSEPAKLKLIGKGEISAVNRDESRVKLASGAGEVRLGDKVVLLPRAKDAAFTAAIELTVIAGVDDSEVPVSDVNVYRDGTWIGTTSESGRLRAPVGPDTRHHFLFVKSGIKPHSEELKSGRSTIKKKVVMPYTMAVLRLESQPSGARVSVDGRELGITPLDVPVLMGFRRVRVDAGGDWRAFDEVLELTKVEEDYTGLNRIQLESDVIRRAEQLLSRGAFDDAIDLLVDVQPQHPDFSAAHNMLGGLYLDTRKEPERAVEAFETVLARPENRELVNKRFTVTFLNLGRAYYETGTEEGYEKAIRNLEIARGNKRFFPRDRHDLASHDTLYFLALASHKLYHAERSDRLLLETQKRWKDYFDFFPASLEGDEDAQHAREGAEQFYEEIQSQLRE